MAAISFSQPLPHSRARALLADLAKRGGWKAGTVEIKDEEVPDFTDPSKTISQTGLSSTLTGGPMMQDGGFRLQPLVETFADFKQIEILFIQDADPAFTGLRSYTSDPLKVELIKAGGPYRYLVQIDRTAGPLPKLPLTQALQPQAPPRRAERPREGSRAGSMAYVLLVSAAAGLTVFFALLLLTHIRSRRVVRTHSRRPSRP
jgi:hypothetical protein